MHPSDPRGGGTAFYDASSSTPASGVVAFDYSVWSGQTTSDLAVAGAILTGGASIADSAGNAANLALTASAANLHVKIASGWSG